MVFNSEIDDNGSYVAPIVQTATIVTLLGGGELPEGDLSMAVSRAETLVAADGGAARALAAGHVPDAVIGDFDSLPDDIAARIPPDRLHPIGEQDSTDFDKALRNIDAPGILAVGFTGKRLDHELAAFATLVARPRPRCILIGSEDIVFHVPDTLSVDLPAGTRVSLFPMGPVTGRSTGLRWPIGGLRFAPDGRIGTSNVALGGRVALGFDGPGMLVILPKAMLDAAIDAHFR